MKKHKFKTKVVFYKEKDNTVFAVFPEQMFGNDNTVTSYAHVGQHSACSKDYYKDLEEASLEEYLDLFEELTSIGYNLKVVD